MSSEISAKPVQFGSSRAISCHLIYERHFQVSPISRLSDWRWATLRKLEQCRTGEIMNNKLHNLSRSQADENFGIRPVVRVKLVRVKLERRNLRFGAPIGVLLSAGQSESLIQMIQRTL